MQMPTGSFLSTGAGSGSAAGQDPFLPWRGSQSRAERQRSRGNYRAPQERAESRDSGLGDPADPGLASGGHGYCLGMVGTNRIGPRATWVAGPAH